MSSCVEVGSSNNTEQLCYIPCNFCNIVLAVSVPCSSLCEIVTVRCGHCSNLWSVNMAAAAFQALSTTFHHQHQQHYPPPPPPLPPPQAPPPKAKSMSQEYRINLGSSSSSSVRCNNNNNNQMTIRQPTMIPSEQRIVNPPPEKRQRVPSAYNQFIKEEIQRIKANNPNISHREAFSTAAKNWAHFPHIHFGLMLESKNSQAKLDDQNAGKLRKPIAAILNK